MHAWKLVDMQSPRSARLGCEPQLCVASAAMTVVLTSIPAVFEHEISALPRKTGSNTRYRLCTEVGAKSSVCISKDADACECSKHIVTL